MKTTIITSLAVLTLSSHAFAVDRLVPSQYASIQAAIDAASAGDVIQVSPGVYEGPIDTRGKPITVRGAADPVNVVVSGGESVLRCVTSETATTVIENLTFTNGMGLSGGGGRFIRSSPTIRNCRFVGNVLAGPGGECRGGGIYCDDASPTVESTIIGGNLVHPQADSPPCYWAGGGTTLGRGGGVYASGNGTVTLRDCIISGNEVRAEGGGNGACRQPEGGGIYKVGPGTLILDNCTVTGNLLRMTASAAGPYSPDATACAMLVDGPAAISRSRISNNDAYGGGLKFGTYLLAPGVTLQHTTICGNAGGNLTGPFIDLGGNRISASCPSSCSADLTGDGEVNGADLGILLTNWGPCSN